MRDFLVCLIFGFLVYHPYTVLLGEPQLEGVVFCGLVGGVLAYLFDRVTER